MIAAITPAHASSPIWQTYGKARDFVSFRHGESAEGGLWFLGHFFGITLIAISLLMGLFQATALMSTQWSNGDHQASALVASATLMLGASTVFVIWHILKNRPR